MAKEETLTLRKVLKQLKQLENGHTLPLGQVYRVFDTQGNTSREFQKSIKFCWDRLEWPVWDYGFEDNGDISIAVIHPNDFKKYNIK